MVSTDFGAGTGLNLMHNSMMMMTTRTHRPWDLPTLSNGYQRLFPWK
jgi:hypothetical protein